MFDVGYFPPLPPPWSATLMPKRPISYGYAAIILGLKVFLAALVIAIGVVFIWIGVTGDLL
jgi:hypothetical protein